MCVCACTNSLSTFSSSCYGSGRLRRRSLTFLFARPSSLLVVYCGILLFCLRPSSLLFVLFVISRVFSAVSFPFSPSVCLVAIFIYFINKTKMEHLSVASQLSFQGIFIVGFTVVFFFFCYRLNEDTVVCVVVEVCW